MPFYFSNLILQFAISIPAYNEANNIRPLYKKLNETLEEKRDEVDFEILFINDGSKDNTVSEVLS
ncbi:TPA: glycosyltransferase, partial [Streptococcus agalactiae]